MNTTPQNPDAIVDRLFNNESLRRRLEELKSPQEIMNFLKSEGYEISESDFKEALRRKIGTINEDKSLSEAELQNVAGGSFGIGMRALGYLLLAFEKGGEWAAQRGLTYVGNQVKDNMEQK